MIETRSEAVTQYESHVDLLMHLELGGLTSVTGNAARIGPLSPQSGKSCAAQERLRLEEQRRILLCVVIWLPEGQNGEIKHGRNFILPIR